MQILLDDEVVGRAVSTKERAKPLFVSVGHKVSLDKSIEIVKNCMKQGHKLPEPIVIAQMLIKKKRFLWYLQSMLKKKLI